MLKGRIPECTRKTPEEASQGSAAPLQPPCVPWTCCTGIPRAGQQHQQLELFLRGACRGCPCRLDLLLPSLRSASPRLSFLTSARRRQSSPRHPFVRTLGLWGHHRTHQSKHAAGAGLWHP